MSFFNDDVLDALTHEDVLLSTTEQQAYRVACEKVAPQKETVKTKKSTEHSRRYTLLHIPSATVQNTMTHWIVLPGKPNWHTKDNEREKGEKRKLVIKMVINIETGSKLIIKIRRPEIRKEASKMNAFYSTGIVEKTKKEANNLQLLGATASWFTRQTNHGKKGYVLSNYAGKLSLFDIVNNRKAKAVDLVTLLVCAGTALQATHTAGFIHCDFKLENVVYDKYTQRISLIDVEWLLRITEGEKGIKVVRGTIEYCHPLWLEDSFERYNKKLPIIYNINNDVYAYLHAVDLTLRQVVSSDLVPEYARNLETVHTQIKQWKNNSLDKLPALSVILDQLRVLDIDPEQTFVKKVEETKQNRSVKLN